MPRLLLASFQTVLLIGILVKVGCHGTSPLINLHDSAPFPDPPSMGVQSDRQGVFMVKNPKQDVNLRAKRHAQFFGPDLEWASSAKFLEKYYKNESLVQER